MPKPTLVKPGRRPRKPARPKKPTCPPHLEGEARKEWRKVCKELHGRGLICKLDRAVIAAYCVAWARWVRAERMLEETGGEVATTANGNEVYNHWWVVANKSREAMLKAAGELGLSPLARRSLKVDRPRGSEPAVDPEDAERMAKTAALRRR